MDYHPFVAMGALQRREANPAQRITRLLFIISALATTAALYLMRG